MVPDVGGLADPGRRRSGCYGDRSLCRGAVALARMKRDAVGTPNQLIVEGPYRYVRTVYLAMVIIIVGLSLLYQAWQVSDVVRTGFLFALGHLAVVFLEEPATRKRFGGAYEDYCRHVPRWLPRLRPRGRTLLGSDLGLTPN